MSQSTLNKPNDKKKSLLKYDILLIIAAILYSIAEYYNKMFPLKISAAALLVVVIITALGLLINKRWVKILCTLIVLALSVAQFYSQYSLNRLVEHKDTSVQRTDLIVLADSPMQRLADSDGKIFGKSSSVSEQSVKGIQDKIAPATMGELIEEKDDITLATKLLHGEIEVMILNEAVRPTIEEVIKDFSTRTRVLESVSVEVEKPKTAKPVNTESETFTILISGLDTEGPVNTVSRSDVNILMTVNPKTHEILTVSIPRDSFMPISCFGDAYDKLTHSGIQGIDCTQTTIENYFGIDINYYARVNFTSVINILNIVGPIDVYSHYTFTTNNGMYTFYEGINTMNADQALLFSRERYNLPNGDIGRGIHQQEVIKATFNKILNSANLFNLEALINQISYSVDTNFGSEELSKLVNKQLNENPSWTFKTFAVSGTGASTPTAMYPYQNLYVMNLDPALVQEAVDMINAMK